MNMSGSPPELINKQILSVFHLNEHYSTIFLNYRTIVLVLLNLPMKETYSKKRNVKYLYNVSLSLVVFSDNTGE